MKEKMYSVKEIAKISGYSASAIHKFLKSINDFCLLKEYEKNPNNPNNPNNFLVLTEDEKETLLILSKRMQSNIAGKAINLTEIEFLAFLKIIPVRNPFLIKSFIESLETNKKLKKTLEESEFKEIKEITKYQKELEPIFNDIVFKKLEIVISKKFIDLENKIDFIQKLLETSGIYSMIEFFYSDQAKKKLSYNLFDEKKISKYNAKEAIIVLPDIAESLEQIAKYFKDIQPNKRISAIEERNTVEIRHLLPLIKQILEKLTFDENKTLQ